MTQIPWEIAPDWQRRSAIDGVRFHRADPGSSPAASHENWLVEKMCDGWKWSPAKESSGEKHSCIPPCDHLPIEQRDKDDLLVAISRAPGASIGAAGNEVPERTHHLLASRCS